MLNVALLGSPTLSLDNQPISLSRRKAEALFIYLTTTRRTHTRDHLCALLWTDDDEKTARAELRRMLSALKRSPLGVYVEADRKAVRLVQQEAMQVDLWQLEDLLNAADWPAFSAAIQQWTLPFLQGFSTGDAPQFDDWQQRMTMNIQQRLIPVIEQLATQAHAQQQYTEASRLLRAWLVIDPDNEEIHRWLMRMYAEDGQASQALEHYEQLRQQLATEMGVEPDEETLKLVESIRVGRPIEQPIFAGGVLPPLPQILIGRDGLLTTLRDRLGVNSRTPEARLVVMQGWPGIGKTTITAALAHDPLVQHHFRDGVLWASLGQAPDLFGTLMKWGNALQLPEMRQATTVADASMILRNAVHDKTMLIIVDDLWEAAHFSWFNIGGRQCATLVTSRLNRVVQAIITRPDDLFRIPVLDEEDALSLLNVLAPTAVSAYPEEVRALIQDVEGLPLALQVIGRLLREEQLLGWGARELLHELRDGARLLEERAPVDRQANGDEVPVTVAALLALSTDTLDEITRKRFALLGVFAPKPAVFELDAMRAVWEVQDGRATVRRLVERGLLEVVAGGEFQMHALLVQHARTMFGGG